MIAAWALGTLWIAQAARLPAGSAVENVSVPRVVVDRLSNDGFDLHGVLDFPHLVVRRDGSYVATVEHRGHRDSQIGTYVYRSADGGRTWARAANLKRPRNTSLFEVRDDLYLLGTGGSGSSYPDDGHPILCRSTDGGVTWSQPGDGAPDGQDGELLEDRNLIADGSAVLEQGGRLWSLFSSVRGEPREAARQPGGRRGIVNYVVASAPIESDLLHSANWTWSAALEIEDFPSPRGILLRSKRSAPSLFAWDLHRGLLFDVAEDARTVIRRGDPERPRAEHSKSYGYLQDEITGTTFVLRMAHWPEFEGVPGTLVLASSKDLRTWTLHSMVLRDRRILRRGVELRAADLAVSGDDLLVVLCSDSPAEEDRVAGPELVFLRVPSFRSRTVENPPVWDAR